MADDFAIVTRLDSFVQELKGIVKALQADGNGTLAHERFKRWNESIRDFVADNISAEKGRRVGEPPAMAAIASRDPVRDFMVNHGNGAFARLTALREAVTSDRVVHKTSEEKRSKTRIKDSVPTVFVVHGHDHGGKEEVARFLEKIKVKVTILHEQANEGRTIIEKFESYSGSASYAVVLLTPDDIGGPAGSTSDVLQHRARQNVIFELGFFFGALGRSRVCALYGQGVELPSDVQGVLYVSFADDKWRLLLAKELKVAGFNIDLNQLI